MASETGNVGLAIHSVGCEGGKTDHERGMAVNAAARIGGIPVERATKETDGAAEVAEDRATEQRS